MLLLLLLLSVLALLWWRWLGRALQAQCAGGSHRTPGWGLEPILISLRLASCGCRPAGCSRGSVGRCPQRTASAHITQVLGLSKSASCMSCCAPAGGSTCCHCLVHDTLQALLSTEGFGCCGSGWSGDCCANELDLDVCYMAGLVHAPVLAGAQDACRLVAGWLHVTFELLLRVQQGNMLCNYEWIRSATLLQLRAHLQAVPAI